MRLVTKQVAVDTTLLLHTKFGGDHDQSSGFCIHHTALRKYVIHLSVMTILSRFHYVCMTPVAPEVIIPDIFTNIK